MASGGKTNTIYTTGQDIQAEELLCYEQHCYCYILHLKCQQQAMVSKCQRGLWNFLHMLMQGGA
jgi:hypothetical protein